MLRDGVVLARVDVQFSSANVRLEFLEEGNALLRDKVMLLEENKVLLLREIARLGVDVGAVVSDTEFE